MSYPEESFAEEARKNREWNEQQQIELAKQIAEQRIAMGKPSPDAVPPPKCIRSNHPYGCRCEEEAAALSARIEELVPRIKACVKVVYKYSYGFDKVAKWDEESLRSALRELVEGK